MRLFVAVYPSAEAVDSLRPVLPRDDGLRWPSYEHWHVTLAFLGDVAERRIDELRDRLGRAAGRTPPLAVSLRSAGTFPKQARRGRQLWVGLAGDVAGLTRLADSCAAAARHAGIVVESRSFRPHLTVARSRGREADMTGAVAALAAYDGPPWTVAEVVLVHSHLGPPLRHDPVGRWPLSGHQA